MAGSAAKTFSCQNCGASVSLRNFDSLTVVCQSCHSIIDAQDENFKIIQAYNDKTSGFEPVLSLGSRGKLAGQLWEVIGFLVRKDIESGFLWDEYLLFNPYQGYRWLAEVSGHWSFVRTIKDMPDASLTRKPTYKGKSFTKFNTGKVTVAYVLGEFYWNVAINEDVYMEDFICPPQMLSSEQSGHELNWSLGEYLEPKQVIDAFKLKEIPERAGIGANQISPASVIFNKILPWWVGFFLLISATEMYQLVTSSNQNVLSQQMEYIPNRKSDKTFTSNIFEMKKKTSNLELIFSTPVGNSWFYLSGELVNNDNGDSFSFDRSIEYYSGYEDGESWSEGSTTQTVLLSGVPQGKYYLNIDYESGSFLDTTPRMLGISARANVPIYANYFWCIFLISIMPIIYWVMSRSEEAKRWANSNCNPYTSLDLSADTSSTDY